MKARKKNVSRISAFLLALVMMLSLVPTMVFAADGSGQDTAIVIAGSDFQNKNCTSTNHTPGVNAVQSIVNRIKGNGYTNVDGFLFCGDYYYTGEGNTTNSLNGLNALSQCITDNFGNNVDKVFVQGNHDKNSVSGISSSGAHDANEYGVYVMDWDDYNGYGASYSACQTMASNLTAYLADRKANHPNQPIFIISHQGLHAGPRTIWGNGYDNCALYAMPIFNAINEAAENLNIIYLFGHNHSKDFDSYLGGSSVFLTKGDTMLVSDAKSSSDRNCSHFTTQTLNFTYMNAGYVGYYEDYSDSDNALTMTSFEINGNQVTINRYDANGVHNLKAAGDHTDCTTDRGTEMTNFVNKFQPDTKVYTSPQVVGTAPVDPVDPVDPEPEEQTFTDPSGISVITTSGTGLSVSAQTVADDVLTANGIDKYQAYDINIAGYEQGKTVKVTMPVPADFDANKTSVYHVNGDGTLQDMGATINGNVASFATDHFSIYMVAESDLDWQLVSTGSGSALTSLKGGEIVNINFKNSNRLSGKDYYVSNGANGDGLELVTNKNTLWSVTKNSDGTYYLRDAAGKYLTIGSGTAAVTTTPTKLALSYSSTYKWQIAETVTNGFNSGNTVSYGYTYSNYTNNGYYYKDGSNYYLVTGLKCDRSGGMGNRTYAWTINCEGGKSFYPTGTGTSYSSITLYQQNTTTYYLNQLGGNNSTMAAGYTVGSNSDAGSRWNLYEVNSVYAALGTAGDFVIPTGQFKTSDEVKDFIKNSIRVYTATNAQGANKTTTNDYTLSGTLNPTADSENNIVTVKYNNVTLGTIKVSFVTKEIDSVTIDKDGTVYVGDLLNTDTGASIVVTYKDGTKEETPITLSMVSGDYDIKKVGTYDGLTVSYGGNPLPFTLNVEVNPNLDPFPKNPNEGSVTINKGAKGIDFKNTGVAQVELSAKGIPFARGVDVIVMLDASSSMVRTPDGMTQPRSYVFADSFKTLLTDLKNANGDINVAIADFNGFNSNSSTTQPYSQDPTNDLMADGQSFSAPGYGYVYTGTNANQHGSASTLDASAFIDASDLDVTTIYNKFHTNARNDQANGSVAKNTNSPYASGTNYDYAFWATYQLGSAIEAKNKADGNERDLIVVFMTDGAANQYNGFTTNTSDTKATPQWSYWLTGTPDGKSTGATEELFTQYVNTKSQHKYFFGGVGTYAQKHRWNEAVKGDPATNYDVIDKTKNTSSALAATGKQYIDSVPGLGATVYSIGFCLAPDGYLTVENAEQLVKQMATSDDYFHIANSASDLDAVFATIKGDIFEAATEAHFEDEMGAQYDLQIGNFGRSKDQPSDIKVVTYDVWTRNDYTSGRCTIDQVGTRKGTSTTVETVTFNAAGTEAYSDQLGSGNILSDGLIVAKSFVYNTTGSDKNVEFNGKTVTVGAESFYWNLGTVGEKEYALQYYVYLTGTMEGKRDAGSYPTNDHATLFYTNYAGANVKQDAPIPVMPWEAAVVKYAAYLVDEHGNPIDTKGNVTGFADRVIVTNPQLGGKILFNSDGTDVSATVLATRLPKEYTLYDPAASYTVTANSNGGGSWSIHNGKTPDTTYVTGFNGANAFSNATSGTGDYDYSATTVWFAVVCKVGAIKDVVVIDYGLPVDISVMSNDMFFDKGTLDSIGNPDASAVTGKNGTAPRVGGFSDKYVSDYGTATVRGNYVRYQVKDMNMTEADSFYYAVNYDNSTYYYGEVTVIPATTIYYEDSFVTFDGGWTTAGKVNTTATQDEDRPGEFNLTTIDANNVYGYDSAYKECSTYSLGSAHKVTVDSNTYTATGKWPTAQFTFTGTGFDVVSVTSNMSGFMKVDVYQGDTATGTPYKSWAVDTYYGYTFAENSSNPYIKYTWTYGEDGLWHISDKAEVTTNVPAAGETTEVPTSPVKGDTIVSFEKNGVWTATNSGDNALYQIPVIKGEGFTYGQYTVVISAMYANFFNHTASGNSYDLYLDAIRIYDPAKNDTTSQEAYVMDKEATPSYLEIRNNLIDAKTFAASGSDVPGAVFIDGLGDKANVADYTSYGPNNEVYLNKNQSVAFKLTNGFNVDSVQLGVKAPMGETTVRIDAIKTKTIDKNGTPEQVTIRDTKTIVTKSATDMFYDITDLVGFDADGNSSVIIITCTDGSLASLTNIKITHISAPAKVAAAPRMMMSAPAAKMVESYVGALYLAALPVEQVVSEEPTPGQVDDPEVIPTTDPTEPEENDPVDNLEQNEKQDHKDKNDKSKKDKIFKPDKMDVTVNKDNIKVGDKVTLNVKTSQDVKAVTVNGENAVLTKSNEAADEAIWSVTAKAAEAGVLENAVVAYDEDGTASEEIISVENVKESRTLGQIIMSFIQWIINWVSGWFKG